nr:SRPBCC family protein [uncultured Undibacterium sp.]
MQITVETTIAAPISTVWSLYNTPEHIKNWNAASDDWHTTASAVDLREGGAFSSRMEAKDGSMGFDFAGNFTKIIEHALIEYTFGDRKATIQFADTAEGVKLSITFEAETTYSTEQQQQGWQAILNNFKRYVESRP